MLACSSHAKIPKPTALLESIKVEDNLMMMAVVVVMIMMRRIMMAKTTTNIY